MDFIIYRATNKITGHSYVGYTYHSLNTVMGRHYHNAIVKQNTTKIAQALREYRGTDFMWVILDRAETEIEAKEKMDYPL